MAKLWAAEIAVKALQAEGVDTMFGLTGGHIQPLQDYAYRAGINVVQVRHEQAAAYAADGYARVTRRPGVCYGTAGPGMLNMVTGIHMAYASRTPMVCLFGGHKERESHRGSMQEAYAADVCRSLTKWTIRVTEPDLASHFIRKAFRDAMTPPFGPVGIEFPLDTFNWEPVEESGQVAYRPGPWRPAETARRAADPRFAARAMELLLKAKRPLVIGGEGLHWSGSEEVLKELVERTRTPFCLRRLGRGVIAEDHPLAISAGARRDVLGDADVVLLVGLQVAYFESFGEWKTNARFIQVQSCEEDLVATLPSDVQLVGDPATILRQMLDSAPTLSVAGEGDAWVAHARKAQAGYLERMSAAASGVATANPIHPRWLAKAVSDFVTPEFNIVFDGFTPSTFLGEQLLAKRGGQVLDAGLSAAFGHGVGMAIGAQIGRPGAPVLVMMGDGGMGVAGGDIETAVRYQLPIVFLIYNDSTFCAGLEQYCYGEGFRVLGPEARKGFRLTQDIRYDLMYAPLGCHTEHVESPSEIVPALQRSFASGKTAVINLIGTRNVQHPLYDSANAREMFWHLPPEEIEAPARTRHHDYFYPKFHGGQRLGD